MAIIRPLTTLEDCQRVVALEKEVWGYTDAEDVVPAPILIVTIKRGGILLGAIDETGGMIGFVYSIPGLKHGQPMQWSHMLGVTAAARSANLGTRLKLAQRDATRAMGLSLIEWTYDPLQALNAHLNFAKLGVVVEEYEENIYGESSSVLHRGSPTDRFVAEWHLDEPHVERRTSEKAGLLIRDASVASAPVVNPSQGHGRWLAPAAGRLDLDDRRVLVEIPVGFTEMQAQAPELALGWRMETRRIFQAYFSRGYRAVDFFLAREAGRGQYLLARRDQLAGEGLVTLPFSDPGRR
jgi:predicted GNAT superfamily acetyltransferase